MNSPPLGRRDLLKVSVLGVAALALPFERVALAKSASRIASSKVPAPYTVPFTVPPVLARVPGPDSGTDYYRVHQRYFVGEILPGVKTPLFGYNSLVPGPTIRAVTGRPIVVRMLNELPPTHPQLGYQTWTSTHLHGSASKPQFDGYASDITRPGQWKDYHYPNVQQARTLWYHDHGVAHTAENAYMGLAAQFHLIDNLEQSLPIPHGDYELPLILQDKIFASDGSLLFDDQGHSGLYGDVILVNGRPWPAMKVARRKYRFRVLNAALSRGFRLALSTGDPMTVIGTDGGLMVSPQTTTSLRMGMAERYELVIDFAKYAPGQRVELRNLGVPNSVDFPNTDKVMAFDVSGEPFDPAGNEIPAVLNPNASGMDLTAADAARTTKLEVIRTDGEWSINGSSWTDVIDSNFQKVVANPGPGEVQIWEIKNSSGGWFHPVHLHLVDFQVLSRNGGPPLPYERGPKDVVYVGENEIVRVIARFGEFGRTGRYMVHCHNLVHEDHDMMVQFRVGADEAPPDPITSEGGNDPIKSAPAVALPAPDFA